VVTLATLRRLVRLRSVCATTADKPATNLLPARLLALFLRSSVIHAAALATFKLSALASELLRAIRNATIVDALDTLPVPAPTVPVGRSVLVPHLLAGALTHLLCLLSDVTVAGVQIIWREIALPNLAVILPRPRVEPSRTKLATNVNKRDTLPEIVLKMLILLLEYRVL